MTDTLDRSRPPAGGTPRPFRFPPFEHRALGPGIDGYLAPLDRGPLVGVELVLGGGGQHDPPGEAGLAAFAGALLDDGCPGLSATEIAARVERLGGEISASSDWDATYVGLTVPSDHLEDALQLTFELALEASFPAEEVERQRQQRLQELLRRSSRPSALAADHLARALYGDSAYGHPLLGQRSSLETLGRRDLVAFAEAQFERPATLIVAGSLDATRTWSLAEQLATSWTSQEPAPRPTIDPQPVEGVTAVIVDRPDAAQTDLRVGHAGPVRTHPDRVPLVVMNTLLGGKFTSRINLNLRERNGFTYGAHSRLPSRLGPGPFQVSTSVATESAAAAAAEILAELHRIQTEPVTGEELADTVSYMLGVFPYTLQTVDDMIARLVQLAVFDLPDDQFERYRAALREVTIDDVQRVAREHLHPAHAVIVAVGPAAELEQPFAKITERLEIVASD